MQVQDDAAYALAANEEGDVVKCSRSIAVMLFLTKVCVMYVCMCVCMHMYVCMCV